MSKSCPNTVEAIFLDLIFHFANSSADSRKEVYNGYDREAAVSRNTLEIRSDRLERYVKS